MKRNKIRILLGTMLTALILLSGCTCRTSVKPAATATPTSRATSSPEATGTATVLPAVTDSPMASAAASPSADSMNTGDTGSGNP